MKLYSSEILPATEKYKILRKYFIKYNLKIFVETGTCSGAAVKSMSDIAERIYSIELNNYLFRRAKKRFGDNKKINIIHGDSTIKLKDIMEIIDLPTLFWLDAHWSGEHTSWGIKKTPIKEEITTILNAPYLNHVIIIDDARYFGVDNCYPKVKDILKMVNNKSHDIKLSTSHDMIIIEPGTVK